MNVKHAQHGNIEERLPVGKAARVIGVHPQTLRNYEAAGYITSSRTVGGERRFRCGDLVELRDNPPELYKRTPPVSAEVA